MPSSSATSAATSAISSVQELTAPTAPACGENQWRWMIADLVDGSPITLLDRQARSRTITYELNKATVISGEVSSDNPEINLTHTDGFPFLAEGDRLIYCFRRDYNGAGTGTAYQCRASGIILQYEDAATSEDGVSRFTAFDPWQYLYAIPVLNPADRGLEDDGVPDGNVDIAYNDNLDQIIISLLVNASVGYNQTWPPLSGPTNMFLDWGWSGSYTGTIESLPVITHTFQKGTTIGQAFDELCALGQVDIVMEPIYDPVNRPGILAQLSVYAVAGEQKEEAIFAWDKPSRSVSQISRLVDGTRRANKIREHTLTGGPSNPDLTLRIITEPASVARFGEYWREDFFADTEHTQTTAAYAQELLDTFSEHARTVQLGPIPERSPIPFLEWYLGDTVRVFASKNLRATMSGFQRVVGFTLELSDDALETVTNLTIYIPSEAETVPTGPEPEVSMTNTTQLPIRVNRRRTASGFITPTRSGP